MFIYLFIFFLQQLSRSTRLIHDYTRLIRLTLLTVLYLLGVVKYNFSGLLLLKCCAGHFFCVA